MFTTHEELLEREGLCRMNGKYVRFRNDRPHCSSSRLPPLPAKENCRGLDGSVRTDARLDKEETWLLDFVEHLRIDRPYSFWIDQPVEFERARFHNGVNAREAWTRKCRDVGYSVLYFKVPAFLFGESQQACMIVAGFSTDGGGGVRAATWFKNQMGVVLDAQRQSKPEPVWKRVCSDAPRRCALDFFISIVRPTSCQTRVWWMIYIYIYIYIYSISSVSSVSSCNTH